MRKIPSLMLIALTTAALVACTNNASNSNSSQKESDSSGDSGYVLPDVPEITRTYTKIESDTLYTKKVDNITDDFIIGMDSSSVIAEEESGVKYYDFDGKEKDLMEILSNNGVNYIRVRVWNDPYDSKGHGYGGGNCDIAKAIEIGKRATKYNMKLLLNFHYSDFWADPSKQMVPKAWEGMDIGTKGEALYEYTKDCLKQLRNEHVAVGMVQIGNETSGGKMAGETRFSYFATLFNKGAEAVREIYPEALVACHFANPEKTNNYRDWASKMAQYKVDYDVFGSSYYPYWHGTLDNLGEILSEIAETYNKKTMVLETSYANTVVDTDFFGNTIGEGGGVAKPYPFTIAGQANCFRDVVDTVVNKCKNGIGVCYWEGTWISVGTNSWEENSAKWEQYGSGWAASYANEYDPNDAGKFYGGTAVDNQCFFDATGHPFESIKVLNNVRFGNDAPRYVDGVQNAEVSHYTYEDFELPATVDVIYNDNSREPLAVTWEPFDIAAAKAAGNGKYEIKGKAEGYDGDVYCYLTVMEYNYLENYGFEDGSKHWTVTNNSSFEYSNEYIVKPTEENPQSGKAAFHFWAKQENVVNFDVEQEVNLEQSGTYKFQASILGGTDYNPCHEDLQNIYLYVKIDDVIAYKVDMKLHGYSAGYYDYLIQNISYEKGQKLVVGFHVEANEKGSWGDIDDCMFNIALQFMKNRYLGLIFISCMLLGACTKPANNVSSSGSPSEDESSEVDDEPKLEKDTAVDYALDNASTNMDGSMSYEIFPRSFYDANGDGTGDLKGIEQKIPYLADLGIKTIWLTPIHPSPTYHGYDVNDYYSVASDLGTLDDFDSLVATAESHHIDIMLDMVFNHCASTNPWFVQSYNDFKNGNTGEGSKVNWFTWSNTAGGACNVKYGNDTTAWYEGRFGASMPDFNFDCQEVRDEIENIMKFWIVDHKVKGFRLDAVLYYYYQDTNKNNAILTWLEETAHKYNPDFYMVGECWQSASVVNSYHKSKLDSFFRFEGSYEGALNIMNVAKGRSKSSKFVDEMVTNINVIKTYNPDAYPSYFMSNHDMNRSAHAFLNENQAKAAASLLAFLPGTSFMYYGEEIGLLGKRVTSPDDLSDARRRLPMIWSENDKTGECVFPERNRQDLAKNEQVTKGVNDRLAENYSVLKHYRKAINIRNKYSFIKQARVASLISELNTELTSVMAYKLYLDSEYIIVVHNFNEKNVEVTVNATEIVDSINTSQLIPEFSNNKLTIGAYSTVIMK